MLVDYQFERCARQCTATGKTLEPGSTVYSVLVREQGRLVRRDYAADAWAGPPSDALAWWQYRVPDQKAARRNWAPSEVMLEFFEQLAEQPDQQDLRYVLALLLIRRRILRQESIRHDDQGRQLLVVHAPQRERDYVVPVVLPGDAMRVTRIQQELERLLQ